MLRLAVPALLGALAPVLPGCGGETPESQPPVERVARQLAAAGAESVIVFVADDDREYVATAGNPPTGILDYGTNVFASDDGDRVAVISVCSGGFSG